MDCMASSFRPTNASKKITSALIAVLAAAYSVPIIDII
jgi:hypothetical protein